jgi:hypothetical protein
MNSRDEVEVAWMIPLQSMAPAAETAPGSVAALVFIGRRKLTMGGRAMFQRQLPAWVLVSCVLALAGCQDREKITIRAVAGTAMERGSSHAGVEYVSGVVTLREGDAITVHVLNYSDGEQPCAIEIYRDTRERAKEVGKNEGYKVRPRGIASSRFTVKMTGEYWVLVKGETPLLAPEATFAGVKSGDNTGESAPTLVVFKPGDFLKVEATPFPAYGRGTERAIPKTTEKETRAIKETKKE